MSSTLRSIEVTLPWPPKEVFPNFRYSHHWRKSWPQVKCVKGTAFFWAKKAIGRQVVARDHMSRWQVHLDFYPPDLRKRDEDGMIGAAKPSLDGIAEALHVDDSLFNITHAIHPPRRPHGAVVITVTAPGA